MKAAGAGSAGFRLARAQFEPIRGPMPLHPLRVARQPPHASMELMTDTMSANESFFFDRFELRPLVRVLLAAGQPIALGARAFDVLLALLQRAGHTLSKHELLETVWPGTIVEESNVQKQICALRDVLGDGFIATIPRRGYRFITAVRGERAAAQPDSQQGSQHALARALADPHASVMLVVIEGRDRLQPGIAQLLSAVLAARPQTPVLLADRTQLAQLTA